MWGRPPEETVEVLDMLFSRFDAPAEGWGLEKIKTIGDAYMTARSFQSKLYAPGG